MLSGKQLKKVAKAQQQEDLLCLDAYTNQHNMQIGCQAASAQGACSLLI